MGGMEETEYGYRLTLSEVADTGEVTALLQEVRRRLREVPDCRPAVLVDLRCTRALPADAQERFKACLAELTKVGIERQAVIVNSPITLLQARRLIREAGIAPLCRYFDPASEPAWEPLAIEWLVHGTEPPVVDDPDEDGADDEDSEE